jgi:aryl-alcohol dehydrogenase-like predicted oxidoreductase
VTGMRRCRIGDLDVSVLGIGTSRLASLGSGHTRAQAARLLDAASDLGVDFIDTADTYGSGAAERLLGSLLRTRPDRFRIATKGGLTVVDFPQPLRPLNQFAKVALRRAGRVHYLAPAVIRRRIEDSLRRLGRETVDLYYLHDPPIEAVTDDLIGVLTRAEREGKIRHIGLSSTSAPVLRADADIPACRAVQTRVNPVDTWASEEWAANAGLATMPIVANQVLARGAMGPNAERDLERQATERGISPTAALLRHAAAQPGVHVVLLGTADPRHLEEAAQALEQPPSVNDRLAALG